MKVYLIFKKIKAWVGTDFLRGQVKRDHQTHPQLH